MHLIWVRRETKYFCKGDWTGNQAKHELICPSGSRNNFATNAPHEKPNRKFNVLVRRTKGGHQMRRERRTTTEGAGTITYTFHFQISNKGGRQACSVKVQAPNIHEATTFFRQNWPMIESMARDGLVSTTGDDRTIKLAAP